MEFSYIFSVSDMTFLSFGCLMLDFILGCQCAVGCVHSHLGGCAPPRKCVTNGCSENDSEHLLKQ